MDRVGTSSVQLIHDALLNSSSVLRDRFCDRFLDMVTAKEEVKALLMKLPDDCSLEDIQYHLYVIEKVRNGLDAADAEGTVDQEEVEHRLSKWLTE